MNKLILSFLCVILAGCATVNIPNYIDPAHPYVHKVYGNYAVIIASIRQVLAQEGWPVHSEANPADYEHSSDAQQDQNKSVLLFTDAKQHSRILYSSYTHLNVFIRPVADGAEVEIRYSCLTPILGKQSKSMRNDKLVDHLFDAIKRRLENFKS